MILDEREKLRFVAYCKQEASTASQMAEQMENLPGSPDWLYKA